MNVNGILSGILTIKEDAGLVIATAVTCITSMIGVQGSEANFLIFLMLSDYASGFILAGIFKKSPKTKDGKLESRVGLKGLFVKGAMLFVVAIAVHLDRLLGTDKIAICTMYFFIANEGVSLAENLGLMGVPFPPIVKNAFSALSKKGESFK